MFDGPTIRWLRGAITMAIVCTILSGCLTLDDFTIRTHQSVRSAKKNAPKSGSEPLEKVSTPGESSTDLELVSSSDVNDMSVTEVDDSTIGVRLTDAVSVTLQQNPHLRVLESLPEEAAQRIQIEETNFDPTFNTNMQYLQGTQQVASALQAVQGGLKQYSTTGFAPMPGSPNLVSLEKRFSTGTTARVGLGSNYNFTSPVGQYLIFNPAYQSAASVTVEQAVFRGFSRDSNLSGIRIAQSEVRQSTAEFQIEVNRTLFEVHRAYWAAWLAHEHVANYEEIIAEAESTLAIEQKRLETGQGDIVAVAQASENLHSLKADLTQAIQKERSTRNQLLSLMGLPANDQRQLKALDNPMDQLAELDLGNGLATAMNLRPELQSGQERVIHARTDLDRRRDQLRPDVRAYGGYALTGLNNNLFGSVNQLSSAEYGTWSLGVRYTYAFGQKAERAGVEQAELGLARQSKTQAETEFVIQQQVRDAHDDVKSSWNIYQGQQQRLAAARIQLETFTKLHSAGEIDLDRLVRARMQWLNATQQVRTSLVEYNLALNSWRFATGEMTSLVKDTSVSRPAEPIPPLPE